MYIVQSRLIKRKKANIINVHVYLEAKLINENIEN